MSGEDDVYLYLLLCCYYLLANGLHMVETVKQRTAVYPHPHKEISALFFVCLKIGFLYVNIVCIV